MNSVFFGNEGLTSTSANFYANIAQEMIQAAQERLNNVKFFQVSVASIGGGEKQLMTVGQKSLDFIKDDLEKVAAMNSFCAWVREAIKEKEGMIGKVSATMLDDWAESQGIGLPEQPKYPEALPSPTEEKSDEELESLKSLLRNVHRDGFIAGEESIINVVDKLTKRN